MNKSEYILSSHENFENQVEELRRIFHSSKQTYKRPKRKTIQSMTNSLKPEVDSSRIANEQDIPDIHNIPNLTKVRSQNKAKIQLVSSGIMDQQVQNTVKDALQKSMTESRGLQRAEQKVIQFLQETEQKDKPQQIHKSDNSKSQKPDEKDTLKQQVEESEISLKKQEASNRDHYQQDKKLQKFLDDQLGLLFENFTSYKQNFLRKAFFYCERINELNLEEAISLIYERDEDSTYEFFLNNEDFKKLYQKIQERKLESQTTQYSSSDKGSDIQAFDIGDHQPVSQNKDINSIAQQLLARFEYVQLEIKLEYYRVLLQLRQKRTESQLRIQQLRKAEQQNLLKYLMYAEEQKTLKHTLNSVMSKYVNIERDYLEIIQKQCQKVIFLGETDFETTYNFIKDLFPFQDSNLIANE